MKAICKYSSADGDKERIGGIKERIPAVVRKSRYSRVIDFQQDGRSWNWRTENNDDNTVIRIIILEPMDWNQSQQPPWKKPDVWPLPYFSFLGISLQLNLPYYCGTFSIVSFNQLHILREKATETEHIVSIQPMLLIDVVCRYKK